MNSHFTSKQMDWNWSLWNNKNQFLWKEIEKQSNHFVLVEVTQRNTINQWGKMVINAIWFLIFVWDRWLERMVKFVFLFSLETKQVFCLHARQIRTKWTLANRKIFQYTYQANKKAFLKFYGWNKKLVVDSLKSLIFVWIKTNTGWFFLFQTFIYTPKLCEVFLIALFYNF